MAIKEKTYRPGSLTPSTNPRNMSVPPIRFDDDEAELVKRKKVKGKKSVKKSRSLSGFLFSFLVRVGIFYTIDAKIQPYYKPLQPHYENAIKTSKPHYKRLKTQSKKYWKKNVEPVRKRLVKTYVDPQRKNIEKHYGTHVQPHLEHFRKTVQPYQEVYNRDVDPYMQQAYAAAVSGSQHSYTFLTVHVQPRVISFLKASHRFYVNHVNPQLRRAYSKYVRPQIEKVLAKIWERKAGQISSEAIQQTRDEAKALKKESDIKTKQEVEKAKAKAQQVEDDPTLLDRLNKAKDSVLGKEPSHEDPIEAAALDAELEAEMEKVQKQLNTWETGLQKLISKEYALLTQRFADLRNRRMADLPDRFASLTEAFVEEEVALVLQRLDRTFKKLSSESGSDGLEERLAKAKDQVEKQETKLSQSASQLSSQISDYYASLLKDEVDSLEASASEIDKFIEAARKDFFRLMDEAKFSHTMNDNDGWNRGILTRSEMYKEEVLAVQSGEKKVNLAVEGTVDLEKESKVGPHIDDLQARVTTLYNAALVEVKAFSVAGLASIRGESARAQVSAATEALSSRANELIGGAASGMLAAALSARERLGFANSGPELSGLLKKASDQVHEATRSAQSALGGSPTPESAAEYVDSIKENVVKGAGDAYEAVGDAINSVGSKAESVYSDVSGNSYASSISSSAASYATEASSLAHQATRSIQSAVGGSPSPETSGDYVDAVKEGAGKFVDSASSLLHEGTRSAASAVGSKPTPESADEYIEFYAGDQANRVAQVKAEAEKLASGFSSYVSQDASEVSSAIYKAAETGVEYVNAVTDKAYEAVKSPSKALHQATESVKSVVGAETTPEAGEYVGEIGKKIKQAQGGVYSSASSLGREASSSLHDATRSVKKATGQSSKPEKVADVIEDVQDYAKEKAQEVKEAAEEVGRMGRRVVDEL